VVGLRSGFLSCLHEPSAKLRISFAALVVAGCAAVAWCTFHLEYQPSPTLRVLGFPAPVAIFELRNGQWSDYVGGPGLFIDLIVVPSLVAMPLSLVLLVRAVRRRTAGIPGRTAPAITREREG
jgi:hypothetical protein